MARKPLTEKELANLKPVRKGEIRNPNGRRGKDGLGGFSLKEHLKRMLAKMGPDERDAFISGLLIKAAGGDVAAFKLVMEMNGEGDGITQEDGGLRINVTLPPKEEV